MAKRRIKVDSEKLRRRIKKGAVQPEVLEKFGLDMDSTAFSREDRADARQKGCPRKDRSAEFERRVRVSKRGSIAISRKLVEALGLRVGDAFQVRPSRAGVSLRKVAGK